MNKHEIRPTLLWAEVNAILTRLAITVEFESEAVAKQAKHETAVALTEWMELHEALPLIKLVWEQRQRCIMTDCRKAASYTRCSGAVCLDCARRLKNEAEANRV